MKGSPSDKLVGWKEISDHLRASVRTVQRWERELGLPVHRLPGSTGHSVFAYADELDRWLSTGDLATRSMLAASPASPRLAVPDLPPLPLSSPKPRGLGRAHKGVRAWRSTVAGALAATVLAGIALRVAWDRHSAWSAPAIASASPILPQPLQTIVIRGHGFGNHTSFADQDTPYLAVRDQSGRWAAGRIIPQNWDEVTLSVASWTDSEIVIAGFSGAYGRSGWKLKPGDKIELAVWNPQSQRGPSLFHLTVNAPAVATRK